MESVNSVGDVNSERRVLPLIRFLLQWDQRLGKMTFGDGESTPENWRNVLLQETSRMTEASARALALKMLDRRVKLTPHEVFLLAFWTMVETPERLYRGLLHEHRARFFENIFGAVPILTSDEEGERNDASPQPSRPVDDDSRVFRLRTRGRLLNAPDLRTGFESRFPNYRCLVENVENADGMRDGHAMKIAVLQRKADANGSHTLSPAAQADVHQFLRETTSVYANVEAIFDCAFGSAVVHFDWADGVNESVAKANIEDAFREWTWARWRFKPWDEVALEHDVHAYLLEHKEMKNIRVSLNRSSTHSGLLTLTLSTENKKVVS